MAIHVSQGRENQLSPKQQQQIRERLQRSIGGRHQSVNLNPFAGQAAKVAGDAIPFLLEAVDTHNPEVFIDFLAWQKIIMPAESFDAFGELLRNQSNEILGAFGPAHQRKARSILWRGIHEMLSSEVRSRIEESIHPSLDEQRSAYIRYLLAGNKDEAIRLVIDLAESHTPMRDIYTHLFEKAVHEIGECWSRNQISLPEAYYAYAVTQLTIPHLYPYFYRDQKNGLSLVAACVGGESHEIGLRMVADFFEMEGWNISYLGSNVAQRQLIYNLEQMRPHALALSVSHAGNLDEAAGLVQSIRENPAIRDTFIVVGGHAFNSRLGLWQEIGANAYAPNAHIAVALTNSRFTEE
mgnify:CR=1 FL=1